MGGIGMMSAGLLGAPGLGYFKDRYAGEALQQEDPSLFAEYKAATPSKFLPFIFPDATGLDGAKLGAVQEKLNTARNELAKEKNYNPQAALDKLTPAEQTVFKAGITGDRKTLVADAVIPAVMAVIYLGLLAYFASIGGYKPVHIGEDETGPLGTGVEAPVR
jgi:hypothetical protein